MGSHFLNLKAGEFSSGWRSEQNSLVRNFRPGMENLTNVFPTGPSLKTRDSTRKIAGNFNVWKSRITTVGMSGPRYLRMVPFKFSAFPDLNFKDYGWQPFSVMLIFTLKERNDTFYLDWTVYAEGENPNEYTDFNLFPRSGEFAPTEFDMGSESDLSSWNIIQNDQFLYILTDRGEFKKVEIKLVDDPTRVTSPDAMDPAPAVGERKFLGRSKPEFNFINQIQENIEKGPSIGAIYWPTKFQDIPFSIIEDLPFDRDGSSSFNDRTTAAQRAEIDVGNSNGTWWAVNPFGNPIDIPGRVISRPKSILTYPISQDIVYVCTYVDKDGNETDPGDPFRVNEFNIIGGASDFYIDEVGSAFYGKDVLGGGTVDITIPDGSHLNIVGRPQNTPLADLATARIRPNKIEPYDCYFNLGNPQFRSGTSGRLNYAKHFRPGHHRIIPGTQWDYALTDDSNSQRRTMIWHIVLAPQTLKDGFRWINIYKKIVNPNTSAEGFPFELFRVIQIPDGVTNLPGQRGLNDKWKSDGSTNGYPYTFKDAGSPTSTSVTVGERFYVLGENKPRVLSFYNQRLFLGNFENFPMLIRASEIGQEDFKRRAPAAPDDAFDFRPSSIDGRVLKFMVALKDLILFTDEGTHVISDQRGVSAGSLSVPQRNPYGIGELHPLVVRDTVLFFEKDGVSLRDYKYNWNIDNFRGDDLMTFARHLVKDQNIVSWAFEKDDIPIVWCVREDGIILSMTYIPELEMFSWAKHKFPNVNTVKSVQTMFNRKNITDIPDTKRVRTNWSVLFHVQNYRGRDEIWEMVRGDEDYLKIGCDNTIEAIVQEGLYVDIATLGPSLQNSSNDLLNVRISAYRKSDSEEVFAPADVPTVGQIVSRINSTLDISKGPLVLSRDGKARLYLLENAEVGDRVIVGFPFRAEIETFPILSEISYERNLDDAIKMTDLTCDVDMSLPFEAASIPGRYVVQKTQGQSLLDFYKGRIETGILSGFTINSKLYVRNIEGRTFNITGFNVRYE